MLVVRSDALTARHLDPLRIDPTIVLAEQARDHRPNVVRQSDPTESSHVRKESVELRRIAHGAAEEVRSIAPGATALTAMPPPPNSLAI